jgi:hypothetical protein
VSSDHVLPQMMDVLLRLPCNKAISSRIETIKYSLFRPAADTLQCFINKAQARDHMLDALQPSVVLDVGEAESDQLILRKIYTRAVQFKQNIDGRKYPPEPTIAPRSILVDCRPQDAQSSSPRFW